MLASNGWSQVLQLRRPIAGDVWPAYSIQRIQWTSENVDNIKIESSLDSGRTWSLIVNSYPASAQFYEWEVPNKISDSCFIRITDIVNSSVSSSNFRANPFKIPAPGISIDTLQQVLHAGTVTSLTWLSSGIRKVNLYVSFDNKNTYQKIADSISATVFYYNWMVPDIPGSNYWLKIENAENTSLSAISPVSFSIARLPQISLSKFKGGNFDGHSTNNNKSGSLYFTRPKNTDSAFGGDTYSLKWIHNNIDQVNLYFSADSGNNWVSVVRNYPAAAGNFEWELPNNPTTKGLLKIANSLDTLQFDLTDSLFIIRKKIIQITYPDTLLNVYHHSSLAINWNSGGIRFLKLVMRYNNKDSLITDSIPAIRENFNWVIPPTLSQPFRLKLIDVADSTTKDSSVFITPVPSPILNATKFKGGSYDGHSTLSNVKAVLKLGKPVAGDSISISTRYTISWKANNLEKIHIDFSSDSGLNWSRVISNIPASSSSYEWKTPSATASKCIIRIYDVADSTTSDQTNGVFALVPKKLKLITDSSNWYRGSPKLIEWSSGGVDSIRIEYRTNASSIWQVLKDIVPANWEVITWVVPETMHDSLQLRISDITDSLVRDIRNYSGHLKTIIKNFSSQKFKGGAFDGHSQRSNINKIIVQKPVENEVLVSGTIYTIEWSTINLQDSIQLQFSIDSGATWITIGKVLASNGRYEWTIPTSLSDEFQELIEIKSDGIGSMQKKSSTSSTKCLIRALDPESGNQIVGISSKPFTIAPNQSLKKAAIRFTSIRDTTYQNNMFLHLNAVVTVSNNAIKYILVAPAASIKKDTVFISQPGTIKIGAFAEAGNGYEASDTIYHNFCVNPPKPLLSFSGTIPLCDNDSLIIQSSSQTGNQWYRNGNSISGATGTSLSVKTTGIYSDTVRINGCFAGSAPVNVVTDINNATTPTINIIKGSARACIGDSIILKSSVIAFNRWILNNQILADTGSSILVIKSGTYKVYTGNGACASDTSSPVSIQINPLPDTLSSTSSVICQLAGQQPLKITSPVPNTTIIWYNNITGGTASTGSPVPNTAIAGTQKYFMALKDTLTGCESRRSVYTVIVQPKPDQPVISRTGDSLISSPASQYRWTLNNNYINGASSRIQKIISKGLYKVEIKKDSSCWSQSDYYYVQTDPQFATQQDITIIAYPNPTQNLFFLQIEMGRRISGFAEIILTDITGQVIWRTRKFIFNESSLRLPVSVKLSKGINTVQVKINGYQSKTLQIIGL